MKANAIVDQKINGNAPLSKVFDNSRNKTNIVRTVETKLILLNWF